MIRWIGVTLLVLGWNGWVRGVEIKPASPWFERRVGTENIYRLDYQGKGWPKLHLDAELKAERFYRLDWKMRKADQDRPGNRLEVELRLGKRLGCQYYPLSGAWNEGVLYFYSASESQVKLAFYVNPPHPVEIEVKDIRLTEMTDRELNGNLIPDGDFEQAAEIPCGWLSRQQDARLGIVPGSDFLSGKQSLELAGPAAVGMQSIRLPVLPGQTYKLSFWARSDRPCSFAAVLQAWALFGHRGKHFHYPYRFKTSTEWHEYSCEVRIPDDVKSYPDLEERLVYLYIGTGEKEPCRLRLDHIQLSPLPAKDPHQ